ncbi:SGNH/GDSL hydrolase family protein [Pigmentiphaga aceris]|uniref:SGNH/GDSL hydrolase family protein n=1 Tax=Pigmentiphaga aceris TaxID=1940612 RepID=A0A5C0AY50_9BURK|nr:SGNH/GDSL hydrolase family protein [Pigmentiphaga aceris]QEI07412.1 SGNH/GDSL hydrolase family protein [Pigmentiphaga aceris]
MSTSLFAASVLIIGGSHLATPNYLISSLHDALQAKGATVHTLGVCGTTPSDWLKETAGTCGGAERVGKTTPTVLGAKAVTQPIGQLISKDKPALVVVVIGDNIAGYGNPGFPKAWAWQQVSSLTKAIAATNTPCVWIGPTWGNEGGHYNRTFPRVQMVSKFLETGVAPCRYIDSLKLSKQGEWPTTDGQHLTATGYRHWGEALAKEISAVPASGKAVQ